jgi:hypothetical protein
MPIESGMLTHSLEGAQKKVETYYYNIRKQVFEYDEVMNTISARPCMPSAVVCWRAVSSSSRWWATVSAP